MGSGSPRVAAVRTGRHYLGYDTDAGYVEVARHRAADELERVLASGGPPEPAGDKAVDRAAVLLRDAGFGVDEQGRRKVGGSRSPCWPPTAPVDEWLVDVVGGFTVGRPGPPAGDVLERTLGRAVRLSDFGAQRPPVAGHRPAAPAIGGGGGAGRGPGAGVRRRAADRGGRRRPSSAWWPTASPRRRRSRSATAGAGLRVDFEDDARHDDERSSRSGDRPIGPR